MLILIWMIYGRCFCLNMKIWLICIVDTMSVTLEVNKLLKLFLFDLNDEIRQNYANFSAYLA